MTDASGPRPPVRPAQRLTPERVRSMQFARTPVGRRGFNEDEVLRFLQRMADEIAARDADEAALRANVAHYKNTLTQWHREHSEQVSDEVTTAPPSRTQPSVDAVNLLSRAQQEADAYVAQTQEYCRRLAADAHEHAQEVLNDARARAEAAADDAATIYRERAGDAYTTDLEELERRLAWARTFVMSLETVETQLRAARQALTYEFDKLGGPPVRLEGPT